VTSCVTRCVTWSSGRSERNRFKDESKRLSAKLDSQLQELAELRRMTSSSSRSTPLKDNSAQTLEQDLSVTSICDSGISVKCDQQPLVTSSSDQFRLEEALKTVQAERDDKKSLLSELETMQKSLSAAVTSMDEMRAGADARARLAEQKEKSLQMSLEENEAKIHSFIEENLNKEKSISILREEVKKLE